MIVIYQKHITAIMPIWVSHQYQSIYFKKDLSISSLFFMDDFLYDKQTL